MHLKRVEVENFKSFGRSRTIPFLDGFTAITGPNGSGKSNIGDAILFVLGPRSNRAIRAGKLTDLIFNGGKERKGADSCKVSLVFDNADRVMPVDSDEVALTRVIRLSRSNPDNSYSHFYINGRPSSLGEFDQVLTQARISADGYNIVRQGDVTRIVEMTNLERRRILDDIAGITKFDADIEKAAKEKAEVEANLERVGIILDEIDRQLATLEKERDDALKYKTVKDELDLVKAKLAVRRLEGLETDLAGVHQAIEKHEAEQKGLKDALLALEVDMEKVLAEIQGIEDEIAERGGADAAQLKEKIDELKERQVRATERMNYARMEMDDLKEERRTVEADLKRITKDEAKLKEVAERTAGERDDAKAKADALAADLERTRQLVAQSTGAARDLDRELAQLKQAHEKAGDDHAAATRERDRLTERAERLDTTVAEAEDLLETHKFALKDVEWEMKELQKDAPVVDPEHLQKRLFEKKKAEAKLAGELRDLEPAIRRLQNEYSQLKAEADAAESAARGYTRAVGSIVEARDRGLLKGICGTIAELASVDPKYETAMEIAAGGRMQAVVTETDEDAAAAIEYLKKNKLGRVTFLPLTKMAVGRPAAKPLMAVRDNDAEGFAIDIVSFDSRYKAAFWYVFRDTVVVRHINAARRLMGGVRLVTLDGDIIDQGGAMTGGTVSTRSNLKFGERAKGELEKVAQKLKGALEQQAQLAEDLTGIREDVRGLEEELRGVSASATDVADRLKALESRRKEAEVKVKTLEEDLEKRRRERDEVKTALQAVHGKLDALDADLARLDEERKVKGKLLLTTTKKELADELQRLQNEVEDAKSTLRDAESHLATRDRELALLAERKAEVERKLKEIDEARERHKEMSEAERVVADEAEEELKVLLEVQAAQNDELRELQQRRDKAVDKRAALTGRIEKTRDQMQVKGDLAATQKARIPALEQAIEEVRVEITELPVEAPAEFAESHDELKQRARNLDSTLTRLGDVNLLAIEEYDKQASRKGELVVETERLTTERDNLVTLVDEIVARKKEGFFKVFEEINKNFAQVFAKLSDGGRAELILEDPDEPFEGGLILRAQPKGKKLTRLEALSGGEKSLASMAFIFAIQEFEPSPFYYLDEVDQNLDGINSELLARMVKDNSRLAQFIVVSLRKVTLKEADHVYGVTMQESGLSEVVGEVHINEIVDEPQEAIRATAAGGSN